MKKKITKSVVLASFLFSLVIIGLAFTPHFTCACGQYEDGSQLTNIINSISEIVIGRPLIERNPSPFK